ncbi:MAG: deoxyuridine 5'-triphosphate nucleotidohydrolase [Chloroflexi bacterium]|nr:MAG: deoxyuridine 5'-triphosphate nucleotidohydrolase [Chloroflexota bacterium]
MHDAESGVLSRQQLEALLQRVPPLLENLIAPQEQLQPNGIDITLERVSRFRGPGFIGVANDQRVLPQTDDLDFEPDGTIYLAPGAYQVRFNEIVNIPDDLMAYARPRSSLLRAGVALHTAVWDAGYRGRGVSLMVVYHPAGFRVARDARICQLVFHRLTTATAAGYRGAYLHEGMVAAGSD